MIKLIIVSHWLFDEKKFSTLNTALSFRDGSQITTTESEMISKENSSSKFGESFNTNNADEFGNDTQDSCATPILAPCYQHNEQLFLDGPFDESELTDPSKGYFLCMTLRLSNSV
jgi:hypothetical protein